MIVWASEWVCQVQFFQRDMSRSVSIWDGRICIQQENCPIAWKEFLSGLETMPILQPLEKHGKEVQRALMMTLGTGVGGGIIINGEIVTGRHGLAGEIGHLYVRSDEKDCCNCGGHGCLEQVASATGIVKEAKRQLAESDMESSLRDCEKLTAKEVLDAAKAGDALAEQVMDVVVKYLGIAISHIALTVDPDVFVIGGGVSKAGQYLIDKIKVMYDFYTPISKNRGDIVLATLGNDAGIYGAAKMCLC